jgi:holo-[acyl-carrier protein] synthase
MILGVGLDLVEVGRLESAVSRHGEEFLEEFLSPAEIRRFQQMPRRWPACAAGWAAKEALVKALRTGRTGAISWRDMEVVGPWTAPGLLLGGETARMAARRGVQRVSLGLAWAAGLAAAMVVLEGTPPETEGAPG